MGPPAACFSQEPGTTGLPVMGRAAGVCQALRIKRSGEVGQGVIPGGFSGRGSRGAAGVAVGGGGAARAAQGNSSRWQRSTNSGSDEGFAPGCGVDSASDNVSVLRLIPSASSSRRGGEVAGNNRCPGPGQPAGDATYPDSQIPRPPGRIALVLG